MYDSSQELAPRSHSHADTSDCGVSIPAALGRSVGEESTVDGFSVEEPSEPEETGKTSEARNLSRGPDVAKGCATNADESQKSRSRQSRARYLEILGKAANPAGESLRAQICHVEELRPCDLTRLLNAAGLGPVINERQLYRHRSRAGFQIGGTSRISLIKYIAWLIEERNRPFGSRQSTRRRRRKSEQQDPGYCFVSVPEVLELLEKQRFECALSGRELTPETAVLDHVIPVARGGEHRIENAQVLDAEVNRAKGTLTNDEFIELCRLVAKRNCTTEIHGGEE